MASTKVCLKLLIDTKGEQVLFAEASKEFIDFLFNLLRLPLGTVVRLLTKNGMVGSLGQLYESIENLSDTYLQPNQDKDIILKPSAAVSGLLLPANDGDGDGDGNDKSVPSKLYTCRNHCAYNVTEDLKNCCPQCRTQMTTAVSYVGTRKAEVTHSCAGGFVKEVITYMVMDDLVIQPMSTISSITLLNKFNIKEVGTLQERVVELGMEEGIKLLKTSLQSKNVLTTVFLKEA